MSSRFDLTSKRVSFIIFLLSVLVELCHGGITSEYVRGSDLPDDMPLDSDVFVVPPGPNSPQQVHVTQGNHEGNGVIISWVTPVKPGSKTVRYWCENEKSRKQAEATVNTYRFFNYTSGYIHHCLIDNLEFDTKYYYEIGSGKWSRRFWFFSPPKPGPDVPYTFGLIGDLGQTYASNSTLSHYEMNPGKGQAVLFVGDLSYADEYPNHDNNRWDTWGRFVERSVAYQPWIWTAGNHEIDFVPDIGEIEPFKPFVNRYHTPYKASGSISPLWYSIKRASAYVIVMSSYSSYGKYTPQYKWLKKELQGVNRTETPWLIVLVHSPFYHSYVKHYMEGETLRVMYEQWFVKYKERVSNIAYNIVNGLCEPIPDESAPVYITIGDGGNSEGLLTDMMQPQPKYSAFREASFGHGLLEIKNRTHAYFSWNRNQDGNSMAADSVWLLNRFWRAQKKTWLDAF
ncbi:unnamed protein product [Arabidopsis arenosa]|uniref:Purple acid phosphatase n=1 Tax=Arabidopsis arenosa TaxID=38785 RepID=A0A8S2A449_ARAAE|nr:unnamed protein product [Arabidopsis arenosa]